MTAAGVAAAALLVCAALGFGGAGRAGQTFADFPLFSAGESVDGLPLVAVLRRDDSARYVSFVYGDCLPRDDEGCAPPAEVQVWPACRRSLQLYEPGAAGAPDAPRATVRGVPAVFLDDRLRLELQTSSSTVVVFGDSSGRVARVAAALRPLGDPPSRAPLPPPVPGALEGAVSC